MKGQRIMEQKLHTPEGVRDIYNSECKKKLAVQDKLHQLLHLYGYQDIQTPTFEYFDVFRKEIGTIDSRELYKFFEINGMLSEKSKKYLYGRIFDDAYNNICECVKNQSCKESLKEIKKILFDQKIKESYAYIDNRKYSANLIKLMHHKKIVIIYIYIKMALKNIN